MRERILNDLTAAMKAQDKELLSVIRMVKGDIQMKELDTKTPLTDEEVVTIIAKNIKTRKESIAEFEKGNRNDLIEKTQSEIEILNKYMPEQLNEEEINKELDIIFDEIKPAGINDIGKVMGSVSSKLKGKADMGLVNKLVKDKLSSL